MWGQNDGTTGSIYANRYTPAGGWGTAQLIETASSNAIFQPQIAVDISGNAIAVWVHQDGLAYNLYANRYTPAGGWGTAQLLETGSRFTYEPQIAVDSNGNAIAVWRDFDSTGYPRIHARPYTSAGGWGTKQVIDDIYGSSTSPQIAFDSNGNALAVWKQSSSAGLVNRIYANRYTPASGWGMAQLIQNDGDPGKPRIAVDRSGNAIVVWDQVNYPPAAISGIYANRYTPASGWGTAQRIETGSGSVALPEIAVDGSGNAIAVWMERGATADNIYANRYTPAGGWGTAQLIETGSGPANFPEIAVDGSGNAIAVWRQENGTGPSIFANRYTPAGGWGTAQLIETGSGFADFSQIAVDGSGNAIAVWSQHDGTAWSIYANRFD